MAIPTAPVDFCPQSEAGYEAARGYLRERLAAWSEDSGANLAPDAGEELIHFKWGYLDEHLTRWTCADLDAVLLELYPAKMIVEDDELDEVLSEAAAFICCLAETGLLDPGSEDPEVLGDHLAGIGPRFRRHMADSSRYSSGKRFLLAAAAEGVPLDDQEAVEDFIEAFNASPLAEREAVLGSALRTMPAWAGTGRFTPPGTQPRPRRKPNDRRRHRRR
jgi:hypothetical protein